MHRNLPCWLTLWIVLLAVASHCCCVAGAPSPASPAPAQSQLPQEPVTPLPHWHVKRPNILYILCDDLGYGDVHALNPNRGKIPTPNMDQLASQSMVFTDAHASSSVCTPSRYSILTGRYNWRSHLQTGVLPGNGLPLLEPGRLTVASMLKQQGYSTICLGKWHEGLRFDEHGYSGRIVDGPLQHGFDHYFGIAASLDMPPFAYIEDDHFPEIPTATKKWGRTGPAAPSFEAVNVLPALVKRAGGYLQQHGAAAGGGGSQPFFLYLPLVSPHTPLVPSPQFAGKSPLGPYGDYVMETDWAVGEVLKSLQNAGLSSSTIVFFASDNGCAPYIGVKKLEALGHYPSAQFRGYKSDIWDGGHRVPFFVRWPGVVEQETSTDQTVCLGDLMATLAQITGYSLPAEAGEDSFSILPILLGMQHGPLRYALVNHSIYGYFAIRQDRWKLELCAGSGGWTAPREAAARAQHLPTVQLYDMSHDEGETRNVQGEHPDVVQQLTRLLEASVAQGRTTPGPVQRNDVPIDIWKVPDPTTVATQPAIGND